MTEILDHPSCPMAPVTRHALENGLKLLVKEVHTAPIVAVYFWCGTGSVNERPELNGISHFFEHMFFKGTETRGPMQMDREIKALGGYNNAFTAIEYTAYYVVVPSASFSLAFDILLDAIRHSVFDEQAIESERQVIIEEIKRKEDNPGAHLFESFQERVFAGTPYAQPVLGTPETLARMDRDSFRTYLADFYVPNNMSVCVTGDVEEETVLETVQKNTWDWCPGDAGAKKARPFSRPVARGVQQHRIEKDVRQAYWIFGNVTDGRKDPHTDRALDVLATVLSSGRSSRLYQRLVEKENLVTNADAYNWSLEHSGLFGVEFEAPPENLEDASAAIFDELQNVCNGPVDPDSLKRAKTRLTTGFAYGSETVSNIGRALGRYETLRKAEDALTYVDEIQAVTAEDILKAASANLDLENYTECRMLPAATT